MRVNLVLEWGGVPTLPSFSPPSSSWFAVSDGFYSGPISQAPRDSIASFPAFGARCKYGNTGGGKGLEMRVGKQSKWSETGCRESSGMYRNKNVKPWHLRGCISTCFHFLFFHKPSSLDLPPLPVTCSKWWLLLRLYFTSCLGQFPAFAAPSICHIVYANTEILEKGKDWGTSK